MPMDGNSELLRVNEPKVSVPSRAEGRRLPQVGLALMPDTPIMITRKSVCNICRHGASPTPIATYSSWRVFWKA